MKPAPFEYLRAGSLDEVCDLLARHGPDAKLIAGGQSLVPMMAMRLLRPAWLIDINEVAGLSFVEAGRNSVRIGAGTRQCALLEDTVLSGLLPIIRRALHWVGHDQTRNRGTIGGSLAHADPAAELPLVAVMLDAKIRTLSRSRGRAELSARQFFTGPMSTLLEPDDCLIEVEFPAWSAGRVGSAFDEISIRHGDFALVAVAAQFELDAAGRCIRAALALGGAGPSPLDLSGPASALCGVVLEDAALEDVANAIAKHLEPPSDLHASAEYRRHLARVLTLRVMKRARDDAARVGQGA
jgi:CO/xanthine dehydrogenase FAD-binding subunit